ncbi:hypothetical protein H0H87_000949 [Tephrocybe sp. NHM501043]|nr:hypothetical protein H0H87_000949 [Tephrocybe sp. NHM501043]
MHLMYTIDEKGNRVYTLKRAQLTICGLSARFSPDDKFSRHRVTIKKRNNVLLTQLPCKPM